MKHSKELITNLKNIFEERFSGSPLFIFSPGRINLIGEHTDYNEGFVMPASIDKGIYIAFAKNAVNKLRAYSFDFKEYVEVSIDQLKPVNRDWANYVLGVVSEIQKIKSFSGGLDIVFGGTIPIGSGLSSSAALECGVGFAVNHLFDLGLSRIEIAKSGQLAEHNFVGVRCGIMDQFASIMGRSDQVIKLDCRSMDYSYFPSKFEDYQILLFNSKVKHSLAESSYNKRREECESVVKILQQKNTGIQSLRDVSLALLNSEKNMFSDLLYKRSSYVIEENDRVLKAGEMLKNKQYKEFGQLLFESHQGLSEKYEVSCPELDFLVANIKDNPSVIGARMMGGGFGGCTINLVERSKKESLIQEVSQTYKERFGITLEYYEVEIGEGTHIIN